MVCSIAWTKALQSISISGAYSRSYCKTILLCQTKVRESDLQKAAKRNCVYQQYIYESFLIFFPNLSLHNSRFTSNVTTSFWCDSWINKLDIFTTPYTTPNPPICPITPPLFLLFPFPTDKYSLVPTSWQLVTLLTAGLLLMAVEVWWSHWSNPWQVNEGYRVEH